MKTALIIAGLLIVVSQASFASQSSGSDNKPKPDIAALATQLKLDTSQAQQLTDIMQTHHQAMKQLRQTRQQTREDMHTLRDQHREQLLTVLDHQQLYELEDYMHQFKRRGKSHKKD